MPQSITWAFKQASPAVNALRTTPGPLQGHQLPTHCARCRPDSIDERDDFSSGRRYEITINANASLKLSLLFKAVDVGTHASELPLCLAGACGAAAPAAVDAVVAPERSAESAAAAAEAPQLPALPVAAEALPTRLSVGATSADFGPCIIPSASSMRPPYSKLVELQNECDDTVQWAVGELTCDGEAGCRGVFSLDPSNGELPPRGACTVKV